MRFALPALALVFLATGCRDAVVDPLPDGQGTAASPDGSQSFYLKGPEHMSFGEEREFRTQPNEAATRFAWRIEGDQLFEVDAPSSRITDVTARGYGTAVLVAVHYDAEGRVLGTGRKRVTIGAE